MSSPMQTLLPGLHRALGPLLALTASIAPSEVKGASAFTRKLTRRHPLSAEHQRILTEILVEHLIAVLDQAEGDPDDEDAGDTEPSLGWVGNGCGADGANRMDLEEEHDGREFDTDGDRDKFNGLDFYGLWDFDREASLQPAMLGPVPRIISHRLGEGRQTAIVVRHPDGCSYRYRPIR